MSHTSPIDLSQYNPVNYLWPQFVEKLGLDRAQRAVIQALDLQHMHGSISTMPVLFSETCGLALVNINSVRVKTGFPCYGDGLVLIVSIKDNLVQLLCEV